MVKQILKRIIPKFFLNWYYQFFPALGALIYGFPSKKLTVIGITGTNGKSTVVELLTSVFQQAGINVCSISSIRFQIKDKVWQNKLKMTMPGRMKIQKFLRQAINQGCKYAIVEVTSEGIKQFRHKFIDFKTAAITNLTEEHIEAHGSFENYKKAKAELFKNIEVAVVNLDDKNAEYFLSFGAQKKYGFTITGKESEDRTIKILRAENITGPNFSIKNTEINLKLKGRFNIYNALTVACIALSEGIGLQYIKAGLENVKSISGRLEKVIDRPFSVYVDYAHTPDALINVYKTLSGNGRLVCVLGSCGGGRDKWKRPELGKIAAQYCDKIILTNEDPYDEVPEKILKDIEQGIKNHPNCQLIIDRKEAIKYSLSSAHPGDTVIITGKGREPWMCVANHKKIPWDDRKIVEQKLKL